MKKWKTIERPGPTVVQVDARPTRRGPGIRYRVIDTWSGKVLFAYRIPGDRTFNGLFHRLLGKPLPPVLKK